MAKAVGGTLQVSNDCISDLAGYAALECYGVVGMALADSQGGVARVLPINGLRKGIDVSFEGDALAVDLHVVVEQGVNMAIVSKNLSDAVKFVLTSVAEVKDPVVRVHIEGVRAH